MNDSSDEFEAELDGFPSQGGDIPNLSRDQLEVLASHYAERVRDGLAPAIEDYIDAYPQFEDEIKELFPMVAALEQWKSDKESESLRGGVPDAFDIKQLGDCRIVREIGRGGMGVVFDAVQGTLERRVAVKLLPWRYSMVPHWQKRFEKEARTIAKLKHFNIVPVYSVGTHEGYAYYVMQYIEGVSLSRIIQSLQQNGTVVFSDEIARANFENKTAMGLSAVVGTTRKGLRKDTWRSFARLALQVAQAIQHAHEQGVLHHDIKPANLLVDATGRIWVTDFGLAAEIDTSDEADQGRINGTLRYMAPERFTGGCDQTSDVYSLGITLYELVTCRPAYDVGSRADLIQRVAEGQLPAMKTINKDIPLDLQAIVGKAVQPEPKNRYQSIEEFGDDLQRFINGQRVAARGRAGVLDWLRGKR